MGSPLAAIAYVWLAQAIAFLLVPWTVPLGVRVRAVAFWAAVAPIIFVFQNPLGTLFMAATVLLVLAPLSPVKRTAFFLAVAPAVPVFIFAPLPFPGINYLIDISHYKLASLFLLLPVLLASGARFGSMGAPGIFLIIYILYAALLAGAGTNVTGGLRFLMDYVLILALPYFAFRRVLTDVDDMDTFFQYFLAASVILAVVALVSLFKRWDIYGSFSFFPSEVRGGSLRINTTISTHSMAFHLACAIIILEYLKHRIAIGWLQLNAIRVVLLVAMTTADSRGALLGLAVSAFTYFLIVLNNAAARGLLFFALTIGSGVGAWWLVQGDVTTYDAYGTFSYRQELFWTSVKYIMDHPIFGDVNFLSSGAFDHLLQGQGIIDITNLYLQVALSFGLLGLLLFGFVFIFPSLSTGWMLLRCNPNASAEMETWFRATAVTVAVMAGWFFLIATTSDTGLTLHFGVVFAALCNALRAARPIRPIPAPLANELARPVKEAVA